MYHKVSNLPIKGVDYTRKRAIKLIVSEIKKTLVTFEGLVKFKEFQLVSKFKPAILFKLKFAQRKITTANTI